MKKEKTIKQLFAEILALTKKEAFFDAKLSDGSIVRTDDEAIKQGSKLTLISEDGVVSPVADGDYTLEDGTKITVKSGVVEAIVAAEATTSEDASVADATTVNPTVDAPAVMADTTAPTEAPAETSAPAEGDLAQLLEILKNLTDRVASLEEEIKGTKMSVEKMAAAPAAKAFNSNSGNKETIGDYLAKYKAEHQAKQKANLERVTKFKSEVVKPDAQKFSATPKNVTEKPNNKNLFDFGFGKSSISNG